MPFQLSLPKWRNEELLARHLEALGGRPRVPLGPQPVQTRPGGAASAATATPAAEPAVATAQEPVQHNGLAAADPSPQGEPHWSADGEAELAKIPFFVRGKVRRNTETFARERGVARIDAETLYDAKPHFSR